MAYSAFNEAKIKEQIKRKQETIIRNSKKMRSAPEYVQIGWTDKSGKYPDGTPVSAVARIHEYGLGKHTEKAFVRATNAERQHYWIGVFNDEVRKIMKTKGFLTNNDKHDILQRVADLIKADLQSEIVRIDLVDTTRLKNSIMITFRRR